jgi:hypothetical protein
VQRGQKPTAGHFFHRNLALPAVSQQRWDPQRRIKIDGAFATDMDIKLRWSRAKKRGINALLFFIKKLLKPRLPARRLPVFHLLA